MFDILKYKLKDCYMNINLFDFFELIKDIIARFGYAGVFFGTFIESLFPPIPSEVIMGFSGFLISEGRFQWIPTIFFATLGNALSVSLIWWIGKRYGRDVIVKWGKYIGVNNNDIEKGGQLFSKYGYWAVFFMQIIPLGRTLIAFPAGILNTQYLKFIAANSLGASIWFTFLAYIGYQAGDNWDSIEALVKPFETLLLGLFVIVAIGLCGLFYYQKKQAKLKQ